MRRVRIAEQLSRENLGVLAQQRFGIERGAGVVEIDLPARAQRTQVKLGLRIGGICHRLTLLEVRARACPRGRRRSRPPFSRPRRAPPYHEFVRRCMNSTRVRPRAHTPVPARRR